jgi:tRNA pseudouridine13 synthase
MKLKQQPGDFRVDEVLRDDYLQAKGRHRVYRVTKRKLTSMEAARFLGETAGVSGSDVSMAGLKDKQGVTTQYMSIQKGKRVQYKDQELDIETVGFGRDALSSHDSHGNAFQIIARDLGPSEVVKSVRPWTACESTVCRTTSTSSASETSDTIRAGLPRD